MIVKKYTIEIPDLENFEDYRSGLENVVSDIAKANNELIDQEILLKIHPKEWWCPSWLYKKIIKSHVSVAMFLTKSNL